MKVLVLTGMLVCAACAVQPGSDREVRRERLASEHRALVARLDELQARLLVDAERVRFWEQMRDRHESVSAIACTSQEAHAVAMAESRERLEAADPLTSPTRRQARLASLRPAQETNATQRRR